MLVGPQLGLPGSDAGAIQSRESQLPFLYQLGRLAVPFFRRGQASVPHGRAVDLEECRALQLRRKPSSTLA